MNFDLGELKDYLRIDTNEDDRLLNLFVYAAKEFLLESGVPESDSYQYKIAVMMYVADRYENREPHADPLTYNQHLKGIILQLRKGF